MTILASSTPTRQTPLEAVRSKRLPIGTVETYPHPTNPAVTVTLTTIQNARLAREQQASIYTPLTAVSK